MPSRTHSDQIEELGRMIAELLTERALTKAVIGRLIERIDLIESRLDELWVEQPLVRHQIGELQKAGDEWGRRLWGLALMAIGAVVGGVVTYLARR